MLFLADQSTLEFLRVQGLDSKLPHLYLSGNVPDPGQDAIVFGLVAGAAYLVLAFAASRRLGRAEEERNFSRAARIGWRLAVFLGFFLLWEFSLHAFAAGNPREMYLPDPVGFWRANPSYLGNDRPVADRRQDGRRMNLLSGIHDQDHPPERSPDTVRLLFLGHSQLLSIEPRRYGGSDTYPKVLETLGLQGREGEQVECVNAGVSGYSSWQGLLLLRRLAPMYSPDLVLCAFDYHDANFAFSEDAEVITDNPWVHRLRSVLYSSKIYLLFRRIVLRRKAAENDRRADGPRVPRVSVANYERNLRAMAALSRKYGFRLALILEPIRDHQVSAVSEAYREAARRVAAEEGLPVLDLHTPVAAMPADQRRAMFDDDIHMNVEGHQAIAAMLARLLADQGLLALPDPAGGP